MITTDNASNNTKMIEVLSEVWPDRGIAFDREAQHTRCMAHVINLSIQAALQELRWCKETDQGGFCGYDTSMIPVENDSEDDNDSNNDYEYHSDPDFTQGEVVPTILYKVCC